jgi:hypothetical protein
MWQWLKLYLLDRLSEAETLMSCEEYNQELNRYIRR